ncbi:MAG: primosomal protein N', partial [Parabacteroides sp.]
LERSVSVGCRVIVSFGVKRYYTGIVLELHERQPEGDYELKEIYALLDAAPVVRRPQLRFWQWISTYYLCKLGDVYKAALPAGLKLESETAVSCLPDFVAEAPLRPAEQAVLDAFAGQLKLTVSELAKRTGLRNVVPVVVSLMERGAVQVSEELKRGFVPKMRTFIRLSDAYKPVGEDESPLQQAFELLKKAPKQEHLLLHYLDLTHALNPVLAKEISQEELLERSEDSAATLTALVKRGILCSYKKEIGRLQASVCQLQPLVPLSQPQQKAYEDILQEFRTKEVCLLQGVTSSGKTEIYMHLIAEVLRLGRQVLYLLPEIALTTQITERIARVFGDRLLVYHSKFSDNERVEVWNRLLVSQEPLVVLGVRSSLFLPFHDLGLVIVDEEHETSYKQQDPAPRYHARNAAIVLANMHGGKTLLGSATPSIDSYYNARTGKYGWVRLTTRYGDYRLPEMIPVDIKELRRKKIMKETLFSPLLVEKIRATLARGEQVILFQNRRGFAPVVECRSCGWVPHCVNCDVSLTYHKYRNELVCHYCGYKIWLPPVCPSCHEKEIRMMGFGTEKVEEEIQSLFPEVRVARLDMDSARTRSAYERIIQDFERGKTQILIGTQMLSKGLDFDHVTLVGILNADSLMNFPDFRAHERAFQLMVQVSGRAGRRDKPGQVILQTSQPEHPLIQWVCRFAYQEMVDGQLAERSQFHYPPYYRLIVLHLRSRNEEVLQQLSMRYAEKLRERLGPRVLGPVTPPITRVQTLHLRQIVIKIETAAAIAPMRDLLEQIYQTMQAEPTFKQLIVHYDVDPA